MLDLLIFPRILLPDLDVVLFWGSVLQNFS
jgi:hypothetical protein